MRALPPTRPRLDGESATEMWPLPRRLALLPQHKREFDDFEPPV
jgi:hypothetical protein